MIDEGPGADVVHGGKDNWCANADRKMEHDFTCTYCKRTICWCFGSACDADGQMKEGSGICCDCAIEKCPCDDCEEVRNG